MGEGNPGRKAKARRQGQGCTVLALWAKSQGLQERDRWVLLRGQACVWLHAPECRQQSRVKSKRRKWRRSTHPHQSWTSPSAPGACVLGAGPGAVGGLRNCLLPPSPPPLLFVQRTWRLIIDSQGREAGLEDPPDATSCPCHPASPEPRRDIAPGSADQKIGEGGACPCVNFLAFI